MRLMIIPCNDMMDNDLQSHFHIYWLFVLQYLISFEVQLQIHASVNYSVIGIIIGLPPLQHHAITWTNADLLSIGS